MVTVLCPSLHAQIADRENSALLDDDPHKMFVSTQEILSQNPFCFPPLKFEAKLARSSYLKVSRWDLQCDEIGAK